MRRGQGCQQDLFYVYSFKRKANVGERGRLDHKELLEGQCFPSACDACYTVLEDQALHKDPAVTRRLELLLCLPAMLSAPTVVCGGA